MTAPENTPPAISTYLATLTKALQPLPVAERDDIVQEIASNVAAGLAAGESADDLLTRLGPIDQVAAAMIEERLVTVDQRRSPDESLRIMVMASLVPFAVCLVLWLLVMCSNTVWVYGGWIREHKLTVGTMAQLILSSLPAMIVVTLPIATLFTGLIGIPSLARALSAPLFRKLLPQAAIGILGFGLFMALAGFLLNDLVVAPANHRTVTLQQAVLAKADPALRPATDVGQVSPQEQSFAEVGARIADLERRGMANAELSMLRFDHQLKLSLPACCMATAALGLALGMLLARRRPWPLPAQVILGIGLIVVFYVVYAFARALVAADTLISPAMAAWAWFIISMGLALGLGTLALYRLHREPNRA